MKARILFVDDDPNFIQGLKRRLRPAGEEWDMAFLTSSEEAVELLKRESWDVIVSDMRMPGRDGLELLTEAARLQPGAVRICLSGQTDRLTMLKLMSRAHQYISKPCTAEMIQEVLTRTLRLRALLSQEAIGRIISPNKALPSLPKVFQDLLAELENEDSSPRRLANIIGQDPSMTAKILQMANSALFGPAARISSPVQAVLILGLETIKAAVLAVHVFRSFKGKAVDQAWLDHVWTHSLRTAAFAKAIAEAEGSGRTAVEDAFTAGLLHDIGWLVLAANMPQEHREVIQRWRNGEAQVGEIEREVFGAGHAEIGAYLMGLWGLPQDVVEAIAFHSRPGQSGRSGFSTVTAVHVANFLDNRLHGGDQSGLMRLDVAHLEQGQLKDRLRAWLEACRKIDVEGDKSRKKDDDPADSGQ
jgi:putative nucleotidyltransferase with HDIG domain